MLKELVDLRKKPMANPARMRELEAALRVLRKGPAIKPTTLSGKAKAMLKRPFRTPALAKKVYGSTATRAMTGSPGRLAAVPIGALLGYALQRHIKGE
jgi:hypothetical protein